MFLRFNTRKKDGKIHRYWSIVENRRLRCERVTQRTVFYLEGLVLGLHGTGLRSLALGKGFPESAPFTEAERAWINGLLAGVFARTGPGAITAQPANVTATTMR